MMFGVGVWSLILMSPQMNIDPDWFILGVTAEKKVNIHCDQDGICSNDQQPRGVSRTTLKLWEVPRIDLGLVGAFVHGDFWVAECFSIARVTLKNPQTITSPMTPPMGPMQFDGQSYAWAQKWTIPPTANICKPHAYYSGVSQNAVYQYMDRTHGEGNQSASLLTSKPWNIVSRHHNRRILLNINRWQRYDWKHENFHSSSPRVAHRYSDGSGTKSESTSQPG